MGLWAVVLGTLYFFGTVGGLVLLTLLALAVQYEVHGLLEKMGYRPLKALGLVMGAGIMASSSMDVFLSPKESFSAKGVLLFVLPLFFLPIWRPGKAFIQERLLPTLFALAYVPLMMQFLVRVVAELEAREQGFGLYVAVLIIAVAKFSDVGGLLVGKLCGRHKMAPSISPAKTWEGAVGGVLASMAVGVGLAMLYPSYRIAFNVPGPKQSDICCLDLWALLGFSALIGAVAIASDLVESVLKRAAGVKDSGAVIPGIGGALDLADSLLLTAPVAYLLLVR